MLLITDADFAAGVVSQKSGVRGTLKGQGTPQCKVDYVAFEEKVEPGELFYTSGDDRIFPRGFPVGVVESVRPGQPFQGDSGRAHPAAARPGGCADPVEGVHQTIPDAPATIQPIYIAPPPPGSEAQARRSRAPQPGGHGSRPLRTQYKALGEEQKHTYGDNPPGTKLPISRNSANLRTADRRGCAT